MGLFRRRKKTESELAPAMPNLSAIPVQPIDNGDDGDDVVPRELWPELDEFTVEAVADVHNRWNWSIDFDEVYAYSYERQIRRVVELLVRIDGIDHAHQEDREFIFVLCDGSPELVRSSFLRLMTEELAAGN